MVDTARHIYGADLVGQSFRIASCTDSSGSRLINALDEFNIENMKPDLVDKMGHLYFSVPESRAIIKRVKIPSGKNIDDNKLALFEFSSTLLDDIDDFHIEIHSLNGNSDYLDFGYRRQLIDNDSDFYEKLFIKPFGFRLRSWALATGYLNFCQRDGGDFICLLDISVGGVSYCYINGDMPIMVGSIPDKAFADSNDHEILKRSLFDLTATLQYRQDILFKNGCTAPLSLIVISGQSASENLRGMIEEKVGVRTIFPKMRTSLFTSDVAERADRFLINLGLTIE